MLWPFFLATDSGVDPAANPSLLLVVATLLSAPRAKRRATAGACPLYAATKRGDQPSPSQVKGLAPWFSKNSSTPT